MSDGAEGGKDGPDALGVFEAIAAARRSVRAFLPTPVDRALIERAVAVAQTAPSSCNTQPWRIEIVSGPPLDRLGAALLETARAGTPPDYDLPPADAYAGVFRERQIDAAVRLYGALGIERGDTAARTAAALENFTFFGAPHAAFVFMPEGAGLREASDCGQFIQTFMLALAAAGVGSCAQGTLSRYGEVVRLHLGLGREHRLLLGISFGLADADHSTARVRTPRSGINEVMGWQA